MKPSEDQIKKIIGRYPKKKALQKLKELNAALKKLGCQSKLENSGTTYRKIVGRR